MQCMPRTSKEVDRCSFLAHHPGLILSHGTETAASFLQRCQQIKGTAASRTSAKREPQGVTCLWFLRSDPLNYGNFTSAKFKSSEYDSAVSGKQRRNRDDRG